ncbi:MAG: hypothetical protein HZB51_06780 [Chloroflexi bacterium]|nr:hypothetical protein [Chloroflexota bacterium]
MQKIIKRIIPAILLVALVLPLVFAAPVVRAFPDNCGTNPSNMFRNGSMAPGHDTSFGIVSQEWQPFAIKGSPRFEWVDNEKWDANGAQYFWSDSVPFDAGIYQTVGGLQPNNYYRFRIGYSHARLDPGNAKNEIHPSMGRQVGVDPFGGTDAQSPNVLWGPSIFNSAAGMNPPELTMTFAARADKATMYFRGIFNGAQGRAKVWFDVACMEAATDMPTATAPAPTATSTLTPTAPRPTAPRAAAAAKVPATPTPTKTPTRIVSEIRAADTATPTPIMLISALSATATPRYARTDEPESAPATFDMGMGLVAGAGIMLTLGGLVFFGIGFVWWQRVH